MQISKTSAAAATFAYLAVLVGENLLFPPWHPCHPAKHSLATPIAALWCTQILVPQWIFNNCRYNQRCKFGGTSASQIIQNVVVGLVLPQTNSAALIDIAGM